MITFVFRPRLDPRQIRAGARFGHSDRQNAVAGNDPWHETIALFVSTGAVEIRPHDTVV